MRMRRRSIGLHLSSPRPAGGVEGLLVSDYSVWPRGKAAPMAGATSRSTGSAECTCAFACRPIWRHRAGSGPARTGGRERGTGAVSGRPWRSPGWRGARGQGGHRRGEASHAAFCGLRERSRRPAGESLAVWPWVLATLTRGAVLHSSLDASALRSTCSSSMAVSMELYAAQWPRLASTERMQPRRATTQLCIRSCSAVAVGQPGLHLARAALAGGVAWRQPAATAHSVLPRACGQRTASTSGHRVRPEADLALAPARVQTFFGFPYVPLSAGSGR